MIWSKWELESEKEENERILGNNVTKAYQKTETLKKMNTEAKIIAKSFDIDDKLNFMGKK